jgi:hypothetical protein
MAVAVADTVCAGENASPMPGKRIVLSGHDPVSYFTAGRPEKGSPQFWFAFDDAVYLFKSAEHRAMFSADPERYAPQFRGYCTMKLSRGEKGEADPEAWVIAEGKLYVFGAKRGVERFKQDAAAVRAKAGSNWQRMLVGE